MIFVGVPPCTGAVAEYIAVPVSSVFGVFSRSGKQPRFIICFI